MEGFACKMACFKPLIAWRGHVQKSGKRSIVFDRRESTSAVELRLPCNQCIGCRLDYAGDWAYRCINEAQTAKSSCFVTLTYDPEFLPVDGQLQLRDFQEFMKRLRRKYGKVRFFHAGEYGSRFGRPHYHALLFGVDFGDRTYFKTSPTGSRVDTSKILSGLWEKGFCSVGDVTFESASYVARYCLKKAEVLNERFEENGEKMEVVQSTGEIRRPEYVTMSRRPGIGRGWYDKFKNDVYPAGYGVLRGGIKRSPPRFYDGLYELENPVDMERIKRYRRSRSELKEKVWNDVLGKSQMLDVNRDERLKVKEEVKIKTMSRFAREKSGQ